MSALGVPATMLVAFQPRSPIYPLPAVKQKNKDKYQDSISGIASFLTSFAKSRDEIVTPEPLPVQQKRKPAPQLQKEKAERKLEHQKLMKEKLAENIKAYNPRTDKNIPHDQNTKKTIFVGRLSYATTEQILREKFEWYGRVVNVHLVKSTVTGVSRGYGFVEYERTRDAEDAYRKVHGCTILNKSVVVDWCKGGIDRRWLPRRLGGGYGPGRNAEKYPRNHNQSDRRSEYRSSEHRFDHRSSEHRPFEHRTSDHRSFR